MAAETAATTFVKRLPRATMTITLRMRVGNESRMSVARTTKRSTLPPSSADRAPIKVPSVPPKTTATKPMKRETREPWITRAKVSRP